MPALYRDHPLSVEDQNLLSRSEKHVSFDPEPQYHEIQVTRNKRRQRVIKHLHVFGLLSIFFGLLFYSHISRHPCHDADLSTMTESTPNHRSASFAFDNLDQFTLSEILDNQGYILLNIRGTITLTASDTPQDAAIVANVSMTSQNIEISSTSFDSTPTGLTIGNPGLTNRSYLRRPTIILDIAVQVKPGVQLSTFNIDTRHLHIEVDPSLDLAVADTTSLSAVSGSINSPVAPSKFASREKYIRSVSGGIRGAYALEDVLSCTSASGGIRIAVVPKKAGKVVAPAAFAAKSESGSCVVEFETVNAPDREYTVDVHSAAGGVGGTYIHGVRTNIESVSGSKRVTVVPYDDRDSELVTKGASGSSDITVRSPLKESKTLGALMSRHESASGSLKLRYPRQWAGTFEGKTVSGSLSVEGPFSEGDDCRGPGWKTATGKSVLEGKAELRFHSVSGGASLVVEELIKG